MKKFSWILALLAALALVFVGVGCSDGGSPTTPPPPPEGDLDFDDPAKIGELLSITQQFGNADKITISFDENVLHFNVPADSSSDNQQFKIGFPTGAEAYLSMDVTFKLTEITTVDAGKKAKLGFKYAIGDGSVDMKPYGDYEINFSGTVGEEVTRSFPISKPATSKLKDGLYILHNIYGDGSTLPVDYKVEIVKIVFVGGEVTACCTDCTVASCEDCGSGECTGNANCGTECCVVIDLNTIDPADLTFDLVLDVVEGVEVNSSISGDDPADAVKSGDNLVFSFTANNQIGLIKLTKYQQELLLAAANANADLKIDLQGTSDNANNYRYVLGNPTAGNSWNGTATFTNVPAAELIGEREIGWGTKNAANFGYFILQNITAGTSTFTVESITITIELPIPCEVCGKIPCECDPIDSPAGKGELDAALNVTYTRAGTKVFSLADWIDGKTEVALPLVKSGTPTVDFVAGGLNVSGRTNDYNGIDFMIKDSEYAALIESHEIKITVYGIVLGGPKAGDLTMILGEPASNWGWLANQAVSGNYGEFKLSYTILPGYLTTGGDSNEQPQDALRIQTNGAGAMSFRITLIELENLGERIPPLAGTITLAGPAAEVSVGDVLTATYSGSETGVTYQFKKDGENVGTASATNTFTTIEAGNYTVTVSATGFLPKTSNSVIVIDPGFVPEDPMTWVELQSGGYITGNGGTVTVETEGLKQSARANNYDGFNVDVAKIRAAFGPGDIVFEVTFDPALSYVDGVFNAGAEMAGSGIAAAWNQGATIVFTLPADNDGGKTNSWGISSGIRIIVNQSVDGAEKPSIIITDIKVEGVSIIAAD